MSLITIIFVLLIGLLLFIVGILRKKRILILVSAIPFAISGWQLIILLLMG
ncbi:hypothetical protein GCM10010978_16050 [Compostibacillus humi]|uniref:Uncharacterized protein n=2 Tax=Compostibacillus humi TaxID=1245525 RepID=A0A8J2ZSK6_9BACI|nr:hypothetical protein GCM10010978_16050 [Compostibacillus humi]HLT56536.1 hypothetical protein [Bacillota bacterium]